MELKGDEYVQLGNNRYIRKDLYMKALNDFITKFDNVKFVGEYDHPIEIKGDDKNGGLY